MSLYLAYLLYLIHNSRGYKRFGIFLKKSLFLWFPTFVNILVKTNNLLIQVKFIYKSPFYTSSDTPISLFCCFSRALWPETSWVTGEPIPFGPIHLDFMGTCAHGEVYIHSFASLLTLKYSVYHEFCIFNLFL